MTKPVIVGYGNPMRGDDGVGWHIIPRLQDVLPGDTIRFVAVHQLVPELAEILSDASHVIFIDGATGENPGEIRQERLQSTDHAKPFHHHLIPETLLSYTRSVYGRSPEGILFTITGSSFEFSESLSPIVEAQIPELVRQICDCISRFGIVEK